MTEWKTSMLSAETISVRLDSSARCAETCTASGGEDLETGFPFSRPWVGSRRFKDGIPQGVASGHTGSVFYILYCILML